MRAIKLPFFKKPVQAKSGRQVFDASPMPEYPFVVVGDIHGRFDLLTKILAQIRSTPMLQGVSEYGLVFVGDYVDRGENSRDVLSHVFRLCTDGDGWVAALLGNHEKMMLDFLDRPESHGPRWLRNGGLQTLASFGIGGISETPGAAALVRARDKLAKTLPADIEAWLRSLPLQVSSGNISVVHAAAKPELAMEDQPAQTLLWGTSSFRKELRQDGRWIVHGHTIVDKPVAKDGCISIDTGAYFSGCLSAAVIQPEEIRFLCT